MARIKARVVGLVTVAALAIGIAALSLWQSELTTAQAAQDESTYIVQKGDSLYSIAHKLNVSLDALAAANGLPTNAILNRKQELTVPSTQPSTAAIQVASAAGAEDAPEEATAEATEERAEEATAEATEEMTAEAMAQEAAAPAPTAETYRVKSGDSLFTIAKKYGVSIQALAAANGLQPNSVLNRGQKLTIPGTGAVAAAPSEAPAAPVAPPAAPTAEATPEATEEAMEEATPEATEEAMEEATPEATEEAMEEATPEATEEMMEEATAEATEEATEETTPEATEEATEEATAEATEEAMEEATAEATEEATEEATPEVTEEAMEEATAEPTEEMAEEADILDTIIEMGDFTTLLATLESAGLTETLKTEGPFTLFAPTDAAFDALPAGTIDGLLASSPDDLSQILLYHLLPGEVLSSDLVDGTTLVTAQGGTVEVSVTADGIKINDATVIVADIQTSNGVIHVIDVVLLPSENTAAVPNGTAATPLEAASSDAASVIIAPTDTGTAAAATRLWQEPDGSIALFSPTAAGGYHSPMAIIGLSRTFEGSVAVNLTTADGTLIAHRMTLGGAEEFAFFETGLRFYVDETTEAILSVMEIDMAEGSILNAVDTPVTLLPGQRVLDVNSPTVGQNVCDPIIVSGYSSTFEANVVLTLSQPNGEVIAQVPTTGGTMGVYRDFATPLSYAVEAPTPLLLSVSETDASGVLSTIDETIIPVTLYPAYSAACY